MSYLGVPPFGQTVRTVTTITATTSQTSFTPTGGYTVGYCDVFYNGVKLVAGTDFTASDGLTVVLAAGATSGAVVEMITYGSVTITDAVRRSGDTFAGAVAINSTLAAGNTTITGTLSATANVNLDTGTLFVDAVNNRVGINNTAPTQALTVTGTSALGNTVVTGTANVSQSLTANTLTVTTNTATIGTSVYVDANGAVALSNTLSSEWSTSGILQVNNPSTYSTLSLATTRAVLDGNRIGSIVWEMPNNTATYRSRAEIECDMKGSTANKFGAQIKINIAPDNSTGLTGSAVFNQYGIGLGSTTPVSGTGIAFPASQNASSDANTLDDYEEGTWTPVGNGITFSSATGQYTKIGNVVTIWWDITFPITSNSGTAYIGGLPFTVASNSWSGSMAITNVSIADVLAFAHAGQAYIYHRNSGNSDYSNAQFSNKFSYGSATYKVS